MSSTAVAALAAGSFSCAPLAEQGRHKLQVVLQPSSATAFRLRLQVVNPDVVTAATSLDVYAMLPRTRLVIGQASMSGQLVVNGIYTTSHNIRVGFVQPDALLPLQVHLVRTDSTSTETPVNLVSLDFALSAAAPRENKVELRVQLEAAASILDRSIAHSLPPAPGKVVSCSEQNQATPSLRSLVCVGVGPLAASTSYQLAFRVMLPYDVFQANYSTTTFGALRIYPAKTISPLQRSFYVGRSDQLFAHLAASPAVYMIGRDTAFFNYFQTFFTQNIIASARDFPSYVNDPAVYPNNRPVSTPGQSAGFTDFFVVNQNLDFVNYLKQFNDLFFAAAYFTSSDLVSGYESALV